MAVLLEDLRQTLATKPSRVVFIVGTGVAVGALHGSERASLGTWAGLLEEGLRRAHELGALDERTFAHYQQQLGLSFPEALLGVADIVSRRLGAPHGGEFSRWLRETVGSFHEDIRDRAVLDALADHQRRGVLLATTNYDYLLETVTALKPTTWRRVAGVERAIGGSEPRVLHLHGEWEDPDSIVLGTPSYIDVARDPHAQAVLTALRTDRTFVFVGCGAGLRDPNLGAFLKWTGETFGRAETRHFRLCRSDEVEALRREHPSEQRIFPLAYGDNHADLAPFLRALLPTTTTTSVPPPAQPTPPAGRRYLPTKVRPGHDDILSPGTADLPADPSPSQLLHPTYQVVPFYMAGRADELAELDTWCTTGSEVRARLIHGPGGFGKTRLAIKWTRDLRERGWAAGFLRAGVAEDWFARLLGLNVPIAVVIDYAESRADLRRLLDPVLRYARADGGKTRARILLLARGAGDWWNALIANDELLRAFLAEIPPVQIGPLAAAPGTRAEVFRGAAAEFASRRRRAAPRKAPDDLADAVFERVLYLHMAALAVVEELDLRTPRLGRMDGEETLMEAILEHEERFWDERQGRCDRTHRIQVGRARQLVAAATLRGGLSTRDAATAVAASVLGGTDEPLLVLIHDIYGDSDHGRHAGAYMGPLEPDLLGEGMVRRTYDRVNERPSDYIDRVFGDADADAIRHGFVVLGRTSSGKGPEVRPWIDRLLATELKERAPLAFEAAKAVGRRTAFSDLGEALADALEREGDTSMAKAIERGGIPDQTVGLRRVAAWIYRMQLDAPLRAEEEGGLRERARLLNNLGNRQSELGQRESALESTEESVRIRRELAKRNHGDHG